MIDALSGNPVARALGVALLQFVWQGALIACVTALALQMLRRHSANARYLVACLGLVLMFAAPIVTAAAFSPDFTVDPAAREAGSAATDAALTGATPLPAVSVADASLSGSLLRFWRGDRLERQLSVIVALWALGVILLTLQLAGSWLLVERIRRVSTRPLARVSEACLREMAARMNVTRRLRVAVSARVKVPTVIGWIRPLILIPTSVMAGLSPFQLQAIIAHEIAHIRRHDYVVNVLQSLVETLLFYHPGVWWVSKQIRLEREHCCDDAAAEACGDRIAYARALASLEELRTDTPTLALAATGGDLVTRIRRLLGRSQPATPRPTWMVIGLTVSTVALVFAGGRVGGASAATAPGMVDAGSHGIAAPAAQIISVPAGRVTPAAAPPAATQPQTPKPEQAAVPLASADQQQVQQVEGQFHVARMRHDVGTATYLLANEFVGTDQNGRTRNKTEALELIGKLDVSAVGMSISNVKTSNGLAVVTGSSVEESPTGTDRMLFTRVWRKDDAGWWRLVSSSQFRDPRFVAAPRETQQPQGTGVNPPPPPPPGTALRVGGDIKEPRKILDMKPVYPEIAMASKVQGIVIMETTIDEGGAVANARVLRSVPLLDQAALDAVKQWKFTPTLLNGVPVQVIMTVTVNFTLQ